MRCGVEVTVVEAAPRRSPDRSASEVGTWFARLHRRRGVTVLAGTRIAGVHGIASVRELSLDDGTRLPADVVLVAVGAAPDTRWFGGDDPRCPASSRPGTSRGSSTGRPRSAARRNAARAMLGRPPAPASARRASGPTSTACASSSSATRPAPSARRSTAIPDACDFSVTYWRGGRPQAMLLAGRPAELPGARRTIAARR